MGRRQFEAPEDGSTRVVGMTFGGCHELEDGFPIISPAVQPADRGCEGSAKGGARTKAATNRNIAFDRDEQGPVMEPTSGVDDESVIPRRRNPPFITPFDADRTAQFERQRETIKPGPEVG
jgi:hypothetical protein